MGKRARRLKREKKLEPMIQCVDRYGRPLRELTHAEYILQYNEAMHKLATEPPSYARDKKDNVDHLRLYRD